MLPWQQILTDCTPERLAQLIRDLAAHRDPADRAGIDVATLVARLTDGYDLGTGAERVRAHQRIRRMVEDPVAQLDAMRYVHMKN